MTMNKTLLDKARGAASQAVAGAQDALATAQTKLDDLSRASQLDDALAALGAAVYGLQRSESSQEDVDAAMAAVDAHVEQYGWTRDSA